MADATPEITKQINNLYWEMVWPELCWRCAACEAIIGPPSDDPPHDCPYCGEEQR